MTPALRRKLSLAAFLLAVAGLLFAGVWGLLQRQFDAYVQTALAGTILLVGLGVLLDPDRVRAALTGRQARYGSNAVLASLAFAGILTVITYLAIENTQTLDLTEDQEYTLTTETQLALAELHEPVRLLGFYTPEANASREYVRPLLDEYKQVGDGKVSYEFLDPRSDPVSADQYGVTRDATLVVVLGGHSEVVSSATEEQITSAIVRLANPEARKVYFLTGHGEHEMTSSDASGYSDARQALENKNYKVAGLSLVGGAAVPEDADAVIIAGPVADVPAAEMKALQEYVGQGGSLVVLLEPPVATEVTDLDGLVPYLTSEWGVEARADLIVDLRSTQTLTAVADRYASHPITARLSNLVSYFPSARSLGAVESTPSGIQLTDLVLTGSNSWGKVDREAILAGSLDYVDSEDTPGPLTVAMTVVNSNTGARLVVVGDSDFAANADYASYANGDLLINCIDWAAHQDELISLTPKRSTSRYVVPPTAQTVGLIFLLTVLGIPGAVIAGGVYVWWRRRQQT